MINLTPKRAVAVGAAALAVAGGAGAAVAASGGDAPSPDSFRDSLAKHLGISSERLEDATKAAAKDQVDEARKAGWITQEQADAAKERIESDDFPRLGPPGFFGRGLKRGSHGPGFRLDFHGPGLAFGVGSSAAADYLGLSQEELRDQLRDGRSLADVAKARNKSVDGLKDAMIAPAEKRLDQAVKDGDLTDDQAKTMLDRMRSMLDRLVEGDFPRPPFGRGERMPPPPGHGGWHIPSPGP